MITCDNCGFGHKTVEELKACKPWIAPKPVVVNDPKQLFCPLCGKKLPMSYRSSVADPNLEHWVGFCMEDTLHISSRFYSDKFVSIEVYTKEETNG